MIVWDGFVMFKLSQLDIGWFTDSTTIPCSNTKGLSDVGEESSQGVSSVFLLMLISTILKAKENELTNTKRTATVNQSS